MHGRRLASALILIPLFLLVVVYGGEAGFALLTMGVAGRALWEFIRLLDPWPGVWGVLPLLGAVGLIGVTYGGGLEWFGMGVTLLLLLQLSLAVIEQGDTEANVRRAALRFLGMLYVAGPLSLAVDLRAVPGGEWYILLACGIVWVGDTGAFYIGSALGRHPLAPRVSPHKSVEGSVAGLVSSMGAAWVLARALGMPLSLFATLLLGGVIGGVGQMGDLTESLIKRTLHVKDTGRLIPGHGGLLDRIDSLLFAIPVFDLWVRVGWI
ncbi:MAG: phosphatidate cytidylyltransferase [Candidatus Methylomirabilales bacterium]